MAITNMANKFGENGNRFDLMGDSTDEKPTTGIDENSLYFERDTGDLYYFDGTNWAKVGG